MYISLMQLMILKIEIEYKWKLVQFSPDHYSYAFIWFKTLKDWEKLNHNKDYK